MDKTGGDILEALVFRDRDGICAARSLTHLYLRPHPALRPFVAHYTLCLSAPVPPPPAPGTLTLIPDASGCLVFTLGEGLLDARAYGPTTRTVTVANDLGSGPPRFFVEFQPGGLRAFTGVPQWELADRVWPLAQLSPGLYALAEACFLRSPDLDGFVQALDRGLLALCPALSPAVPLLDHLAASPCSAPAGALAQETGYSIRHLSRLLRTEAGLGVHAFVRVLRINRAVRCLQAGAPSLTRLAQELGYFDQAHFIHDFKAVCEVSPGQYRAGMSAFYKEPLKL